MAVPTRVIIKWLESLGWDTTQESGTPFVKGPYVPDMPDRLAVISSTPGAGYILEAAADSTGFQARVRGGQNNQDDAEDLANSLDLLILNASFPAVVDGVTFIHVDRFGGAPAPLSGTPDSAERVEMVANYIVKAST